MLATQLDHFLGGEPVQHRETQGHESAEFMELFPKGVSYKVECSAFTMRLRTQLCRQSGPHSNGLTSSVKASQNSSSVNGEEGGVESGFRKNQADSGPVRRLYQVKGKKNIRVKEVELNWRSFNQGDCFILDLGQIIVSWSGSKANLFEKQKVQEISALIRDSERNGKAQIQHLSEGEESQEMIQVLGPVPALQEDSTEEDHEADKTNSASLYRVSDATGCMTLSLLCDKTPFDQTLLDRDDCFILDNGSNGKIFLWKGTFTCSLHFQLLADALIQMVLQKFSVFSLTKESLS
ncbi:hypothetical protein MHYP_G00033980 [Metynnis hypsauchen]